MCACYHLACSLGKEIYVNFAQHRARTEHARRAVSSWPVQLLTALWTLPLLKLLLVDSPFLCALFNLFLQWILRFAVDNTSLKPFFPLF